MQSSNNHAASDWPVRPGKLVSQKNAQGNQQDEQIDEQDMQRYQRRVNAKMISVWVLVSVVSVLFFGFIALTWAKNNGYWFG